MSTNLILPTKTVPQTVYQSYRIIKEAWKKYTYGHEQYIQYGLYYSDLYSDRNRDVQEALRRLPEDTWTGRMHRQHRAMQLSRSKIILPEAMWTKNGDPMHKYMEPYLEEIYKENAEKIEWNKK